MPVTPESASFFEEINPNMYSGALRFAQAVGQALPVEIMGVPEDLPQKIMPPSLVAADERFMREARTTQVDNPGVMPQDG